MKFLQITYADPYENWLGIAGGAGFLREIAVERFAAESEIEGASGPGVWLDLLNEDGEILDSKEIAMARAESLLGISAPEIRAKAIAHRDRAQESVRRLGQGDAA